MDAKQIMQIFADTAYVRMGGTVEELKTAEYIQQQVSRMGFAAQVVPFEVPMSKNLEAMLTVDGKTIPCKGYFCCGSGEVEAPFYYLRDKDSLSLSMCRGKIVMIDGYLGYWMYQDLLDNGAVGFVTYDGNANYADRDIDQRELRSWVHKGNKIPGININAKDAISIIESGAKMAKITVRQEECTGNSHNVILDIPGELDQYIAFTAHYVQL